MSEPEGRGGAWTEERGTSDEGRRRLKAPRGRAEKSAPILSAADVRVEFAGRGRRRRGVATAVDGVNLDIAPGEIVALVGESGCGKTTLARTMLGLERPTSGQVRFAGQPLSYRSRALRGYRRSVQLVLQDPTGSLNPRHTVYEAIAEGVRIHRLDNEEARVADALARCGLRPPERFFQRYPHELSGGQRQRVVIAGALVLEPSVLVADEPVASLDASVRGEILSLLLRLRDELGLAALVVTHDLGLAWNIADRLAVMYLGRIVEVAPTARLFSDPRHPYTKGLLAAIPRLADSAFSQVAAADSGPAVAGDMPSALRIPAGCRFRTRCPFAQDVCAQEEPQLRSFGPGHVAACHFPLQAYAPATEASAAPATGASG